MKLKLMPSVLLALPLLAAVGCSSDGDSGHGYDRAHTAGYYQYRDTRAVDRSTGMSPREYRQSTYYNGGENGLAPENYGTTHSDRVANHEAHVEHQYGD